MAFADADVVAVDRIGAFSYTSSVMQMGDPFSVVVPDPRGRFVGKLLPGWSIRFYMSNPAVNGGAPTLKVSGIIVEREVTSDDSGTVIRITGADIGWHLMNNDAPLWFNLRRSSGASPTLLELARACILPHLVWPRQADPRWGFDERIRDSNLDNRTRKKGLVITAAEELSLQLAGIQAPVQVQPGQKIADVLVEWARRAGLMVGVSVDHRLQFFLPDYVQEPEHEIYLYATDDPLARTFNNAQRATRSDTLDSQYTHVTVVGESPIRSLVGVDPTFAPQFATIYGRATPSDWPAGVMPPPFRRYASICDGEITRHPERRAIWFQRRGLFDAQTLRFDVRGHHQNGAWWEADSMCVVRSPPLGVDGAFYVPSVECRRSMQDGDVTVVTLKRPDLLTEIPVRP